MKFPETVWKVIEECVKDHPDDIPTGISAANKRIRQLPEFDGLVDNLMGQAVQNLFYDVRHRLNVDLRNKSGAYGKPAKVSAASACVEAVYLHFIDGVTLGSLMGKDLVRIAASEQAIADGHLFNVRLCTELAKIVPEDKTVKQAVPAKKLDALFKRLRSNAA